MSQRGLHTCIPPEVRSLHARLNAARREYRALSRGANGWTTAKRNVIKAECARLVEQLKALKCR